MKSEQRSLNERTYSTIKKRNQIRQRLQQDREYVAHKSRTMIEDEMSIEDDEDASQANSSRKGVIQSSRL